MANGNRGLAARSPGSALFAARLTEWIAEHGGLLDGLAALRDLNNEEATVDALLAVREVTRLRLSWELWAALLEGEGNDPDEVLAKHLPDDLLGWCRWALWGLRAFETPCIRAVR